MLCCGKDSSKLELVVEGKYQAQNVLDIQYVNSVCVTILVVFFLETIRYAVYQYHFHHESSPIKSATILVHCTPYGPSICEVMPYYIVLEFESSADFRHKKWSNSLAAVSIKHKWQGPQVLEGYCYQGAFFR